MPSRSHPHPADVATSLYLSLGGLAGIIVGGFIIAQGSPLHLINGLLISAAGALLISAAFLTSETHP